MAGKKVNVYLSFIVTLLVLSLCVPFISFAANDGGVGGLGVSSSGGTQGITNPLEQGGITTVSGLLGKIINWMLGLVGFIALIALITGGARMIMDFGSEEQVKKGKTTILWAVIGLLVVIL